MPKTEKNEIQFRETILNQIQDYLNKKITKEEYYEQSEAYRSCRWRHGRPRQSSARRGACDSRA